MKGRQRIVLDTQLFVLLVIGLTSELYIGRHKRMGGYNESDFAVLRDILMMAPPVVVTPHALAETSNLLGYISEPARTEIRAVFRGVIAVSEERHVSSRDAAADAAFMRLGLTDAALLMATTPADLLLTDDLDLHVAALSRGLTSLRLRDL